MITAVDILYIYDPEFESDAKSFKDEYPNSAVCPVKTMDELKECFNQYIQVKFLEMDFHGTPGIFYFANGMAMMGSYLNTLCLNPLFLQKNARILFNGCRVGDGPQGDAFMDSLGSGILKGKGGTVGATTATNISFGFGKVYMKPLSFGRLKVRRYDESGHLVGSQNVDRHGFQR